MDIVIISNKNEKAKKLKGEIESANDDVNVWVEDNMEGVSLILSELQVDIVLSCNKFGDKVVNQIKGNKYKINKETLNVSLTDSVNKRDFNFNLGEDFKPQQINGIMHVAYAKANGFLPQPMQRREK